MRVMKDSVRKAIHAKKVLPRKVNKNNPAIPSSFQMHKVDSSNLLRTDVKQRNSKGKVSEYPKKYNWHSHGNKMQDKVGRADNR